VYTLVLIVCVQRFQCQGYEPCHPGLYECYHPPAIIVNFRVDSRLSIAVIEPPHPRPLLLLSTGGEGGKMSVSAEKGPARGASKGASSTGKAWFIQIAGFFVNPLLELERGTSSGYGQNSGN